MPAKDIYHEAVKNALIKDGWTIIADPYFLQYKDAELYTYFFVEKALLVEQKGRKIVVEINSFISPSPMKDFENTLGQYILYRDILQLANKNYEIYLAIRDTIFDTFFQRKSIQAVVKRNQIEFIIFNNEREEISLWID
ncbi:MAG: XisH family protein [Nostoc sp.]|uniref:XisH family protein n=1 Tax=Nostoc sp. TaxID=1180 RepID=UPI002FF559B0